MTIKSIHLSNGYVLHNRYTIIEVLGKGGFGITYLADMLDTEASEKNEFGHRIQLIKYKKVAIKEYFRDNFCERDHVSNSVIITDSNKKKDFDRMVDKHIKEAKTLFSINHPHIVKIIDTFKANNSAYSVMEYISGSNLQNHIELKGKLSEKEALSYIISIAEAVDYIHEKKILHLDIKPNNIILSNDGRPVLIDFGASLIYKDSGEIKDVDSTSEIVSGITKYYTCAEQNSYDTLKKWHPQFDTYSLVATYYFMLTGELPPLTSDADHADRLLVSINHKELNNFHDSIFRKGLNQAFGERFKNPKELLLALKNKNYDYNNKKINVPPPITIDLSKKTQEIISDDKTIIHENMVSSQILKSIESMLNSGDYSKAEIELNIAKNKYGFRNNDLLYLENRLLREKKKSFFFPIIILISIFVIIVSFIFYTKEIKKSSSIAPAPVIQKTKDSIPIKDFLERHIDTDILAHYNNRLNEFEDGRDQVENILYKYNEQFDYTNYYGLSTNSIPNGLGKATNRGINPKNNVPYNSIIQGEFVDGLLNGYGKLEQFDGSEYTGFFKDGLPYGEGTYYENKNSAPITVTCENGKCTPK
jgi:serine/threonine protein kinase